MPTTRFKRLCFQFALCGVAATVVAVAIIGYRFNAAKRTQIELVPQVVYPTNDSAPFVAVRASIVAALESLSWPGSRPALAAATIELVGDRAVVVVHSVGYTPVFDGVEVKDRHGTTLVSWQAPKSLAEAMAKDEQEMLLHRVSFEVDPEVYWRVKESKGSVVYKGASTVELLALEN
ncbi:MAG: hypothetical protein KatS3mg104_0779 [Phycisphaerae bacterium]|nr:MAG: hypothetical protein KatS3mg104_0779 [Phycisphaerae bacterium]